MIDVARQDYPDRDTLMRSLAELVADQLRAAHATKHRASLAVPGGTTPGPFLTALSDADLVWSEIDVIPTDERQVSELSHRSNARLIRETLLRGPAADARFIPLQDGLRRVEPILPLDVLVLGMGGDMHTASLFPGAPELRDALATGAPALMEITPPDQPERRITLTGPAIASASVIHVLITGSDKLAVLATALEDGPASVAPIRVALTAPCPVTVHYAD